MLIEATYRAGYASGAENTQLEQRRRPFLIEGEAVAEWRGENPAPPTHMEEHAFRTGYQDGVEAMQLERVRKAWRIEDEAATDFMSAMLSLAA